MYIVNLLLAVVLFLQASFMNIGKTLKIILTVLGVLNVFVSVMGIMANDGLI